MMNKRTLERREFELAVTAVEERKFEAMSRHLETRILRMRFDTE